MSLYSGTVEQAVSRAMRSRGAKEGLSAAALEQLEAHAKKNWLPLLDGFGLDEHQIAELMRLALHIEIEKAAGRMTEEKVRAWDALFYADMRAQRFTNKQIGAKLSALESRLLDEKPQAHAGLDRGYPLGHHPRVMRMLLGWHDRRTADDGFKTRSANAKMVPAGDSVITPAPTGREGAVALRSLGRNPLGSNLDAG